MVRTKKAFSGRNSLINQFGEDYRQFGESFNLNDNKSEIMLAVKDAQHQQDLFHKQLEYELALEEVKSSKKKEVDEAIETYKKEMMSKESLHA